MTYDQIEKKPVWKEKVRADELLDENGKPIWEGYLLAVEGSQLWIVGSDTRGTIYGIYDLARRLGVSPWYFFADVPVKKRTSFRLPDDVGALKAIEQDLEFYTRFAWEIEKEKTTKDVEEFLISWINMEFSGGVGEKTGALLKRFSQITNVRKIRHHTGTQPGGGRAGAVCSEKGKRAWREDFDGSQLPCEAVECGSGRKTETAHGTHFFCRRMPPWLSEKYGAVRCPGIWNRGSCNHTHNSR